MALAIKTPISDLVEQFLDLEEMAGRIETELPKAYQALIEAQQEDVSAAMRAGGLGDMEPSQRVGKRMVRYNDLSSKAEACRRMLSALRARIQEGLESERQELLAGLRSERDELRRKDQALRMEFTAAMARATFLAIGIWGREEAARREAQLFVEKEDLNFYWSEIDRLKAEAGIESFPAPPCDLLKSNEAAQRKAQVPISTENIDKRIETERQLRGAPRETGGDEEGLQ